MSPVRGCFVNLPPGRQLTNSATQDSMAALESYSSFAPSNTSSPQAASMPRSAPATTSSARRYSRQFDVPAPLETGKSQLVPTM